MKHIKTFESFLNEGAKDDNVITFKKFKDIDHTRLVKWMQNEFGNKYNPGMKWLDGHLINGGDFELDVSDWDKKDLADLKKYLKSQSYISEGIVNEAVNIDSSKYVRAHGKQPKGSGQWGFEIKGEEVFTPTAMTYADAQKWAKEEGKKAGAITVYTLG
jgi:hypothetical protein